MFDESISTLIGDVIDDVLEGSEVSLVKRASKSTAQWDKTLELEWDTEGIVADKVIN